MGLNKKISARAMRRTFQDLAREANIDSIVQRCICGHATQEMSQLYSTVGQKETQGPWARSSRSAGTREVSTDPEYARQKRAFRGLGRGSAHGSRSPPNQLT